MAETRPTRTARSQRAKRTFDLEPSRSAARVLSMIDLFLTDQEGLSLTDVSNRLNLPKSTAHGVLKTMQARGYVTWDAATRRYSIGLRLMALAGAASIRQTIISQGRPSLERLARDLQESAVLHAYESEGVVAIDKVETSRSLRYAATLGHRWPLHASSAGKLWLAEMADDAVRGFVDRNGLERLARHTITDVRALLADLRVIRRNGYAVQYEEALDDIAGFAAPVRMHTGDLVAGLTVIGPIARIRPQRHVIAMTLTAEARKLSDRLVMVSERRRL
jgi:DNA-binding IclR family transcriptional regulator